MTPSMYFNEHDPFAAEWLRNLYHGAVVDERSIADVLPADVADFRRVHWFAGVAGWEYALQLAGWPDEWPVWSGSCPCQPYSAAGKGEGDNDPRNLWPEFFRLIRECRPHVVFGEQVENAIRHGWLDGVSTDLEGEGYAVGACVLGAHSVGAPHIRQRLFWVAIASRPECGSGTEPSRQRGRTLHAADGGGAGRLEHAASDGRQQGRAESERGIVAGGCGAGGLGDTREPRLSLPEQPELSGAERDHEGRATQQPGGAWADFLLIPCRDGKLRRISSQPGDEPLVNGIPRDLGRRKPALRSVAKHARGNRVGRLRGYGNAIVPQVAAVFVRVVIEYLEAANA